MRGRTFFLAVLNLWLILASDFVVAQQQNKLYRIGYLSNTSPSAESARTEAIGKRLGELGYVEAQNIDIHYRYGEGNSERGPKLAAELVSLNCDVIVVAGGYGWVRAVMDATKTIPIVMAGGGLDAVDTGLIKSLARPGGNVTGIISLTSPLSSKRLEIFKEALPKLTRIAVLHDPTVPAGQQTLKNLTPLARALKLTLQPRDVKTVDEFEKVFAGMERQRPDGLFTIGAGGLFFANGKRIVDFALKSRLPSMVGRKSEVEMGGLMSYAADVEDSYRLVAWYIDKLLKGTKPADLPAQQPMKFEFVVNLQTAKKINVTIKTDVLARATKIIR